MKEVFKKIIERLEEEHKLAEEDAERYEKGNSNHFKYAKARGYVNAMEVAIEIVKEVAREVVVAKNATANDGLITLPKVAFDRMIARMESESERDIYEEKSLFINVIDAARIVREIVREHSNSEIPNKSDEGWIPVSSGNMPETEEPCWITYEDAEGKLHVCEDIYCDYGGWYETEDTAVKAWMYVNAPAPYKPKGDE